MNTSTKDSQVTVGSLYSIKSYNPGERAMFLVMALDSDFASGVRFAMNPDGRSARFVAKEEREIAQLTQRVGKVKRHVLKTINISGSVALSAADIEK